VHPGRKARRCSVAQIARLVKSAHLRARESEHHGGGEHVALRDGVQTAQATRSSCRERVLSRELAWSRSSTQQRSEEEVRRRGSTLASADLQSEGAPRQGEACESPKMACAGPAGSRAVSRSIEFQRTRARAGGVGPHQRRFVFPAP
jgi:hypothetical protein